MSNSQVGMVYSRIIDEVINQCRAPFEEEGTRAEVLDDFKLQWQMRISERKVAEMPWDPKAPPAPPATQQAPQPRPAQYVPPPQQANGDVKIKTEPNDLANIPNAQPMYTKANPNLALQNARDAIRDQYGERGEASIQQLNERMGEAPHGVKRSLPQGSPTTEQFDSKRRITEYQAGLGQNAQQRLQQMGGTHRPGQTPLGSAQTDGAADWKAMVAERRALALEGSDDADLSIAERVARMQREEEGNGVMQLHSANARRPRVRSAATGREPGTAAGRPGFDGVDDDDDDASPQVDEADAINSDLDDDEEENLEEEDDERAGEIMVCTYEKVARVKNKWKCTLKDGILVTGGKEYVFGKAQGEFEW